MVPIISIMSNGLSDRASEFKLTLGVVKLTETNIVKAARKRAYEVMYQYAHCKNVNSQESEKLFNEYWNLVDFIKLHKHKLYSRT